MKIHVCISLCRLHFPSFLPILSSRTYATCIQAWRWAGVVKSPPEHSTHAVLLGSENYLRSHFSTQQREPTYCNLILFSRFFSTLLGLSFTFLLLINSEKDGTGSSPVLGEAFSIGEANVQVSDPMLHWISSVMFLVGPWSTVDKGVVGSSAFDDTFSDEELVMALSRLANSVEVVVDSHLTVLATCE